MRELTSTDIRNMAVGCWKRFFSWRWHPKVVLLGVSFVILIGAAIPFLTIGERNNEHDGDKTVILNTQQTGKLWIQVPRSGDVVVLQDGSQVPAIVQERDDSLSRHSVVGVILILCSFIVFLILFYVYSSSRSRYLNWIVERWEKATPEDKKLPDEVSIKEFLKLKKGEV